MTSLVSPGIHRVVLPTRSEWLPEVNAYLIAGPEGLLLIDCGVGTPEALDRLSAGLAAFGAGLDEIRAIVLTHGHPDHLGLARHLADRTRAPVWVHAEELPFIDADTLPERLRRVAAWYRRNGLGEDGDLDWRALPMGHPEPARALSDGEVIEWGGVSLRVVWTPGHSPGLICLHDAAGRTLISSDHVLERISPHIGLHWDSAQDPLREYLDSLRKVAALDVDLLLPGHGDPFRNLGARIAELDLHHEQRCAEIRGAVPRGGIDGQTLASRLSWLGSPDGWSRLDRMSRRSALGETIAHLRYLQRRGELTVEDRDGTLVWLRA